MSRSGPITCRTALAGLVLLTAACVTIRTVDDGVARARLGETVRSGPVSLTPTAVIEDSRCPQTVQCISAGTVRIGVTVAGVPTELVLGSPITAAGGTLTLVEAYPPARAGVTRYPDEYRFGFRWASSPAGAR